MREISDSDTDSFLRKIFSPLLINIFVFLKEQISNFNNLGYDICTMYDLYIGMKQYAGQNRILKRKQKAYTIETLYSTAVPTSLQ
jgi:hypothetical protein